MVKRKVLSTVFSIFLIFAGSVCFGQELEGVVTDENGNYLKDVKVQPSGHLSSVRTDEKGSFKLDKQTFKYWYSLSEKNVVFFRKNGFLTKTLIVEPSAGKLQITLGENREPPIELKPCSAAPDKKIRTAGKLLRINVPINLKIRRSSNFEYTGFYIKYKKKDNESELSGVTGVYGDEFPPTRFILDSSIFEVRQTNLGLDWRGTLKDGKYWRYMATPISSLETYQYMTHSKEAADFFDTILASICASSEKE